ncbi:MAG: ORC1-type DNA replication protein [Candidatus Helarchaeota archaeon]
MNIIEEEINKPTVFKNESKLSADFIPNELPHRKKELQRMAQVFKILLQSPGSASRNVIMTGPVGSGKTAVVKRFTNMLKESSLKRLINLKTVHVNCRKNRTPFMILKTIVRYFDPAIPKRGFSTEELLNILSEYLEDTGTFLLLTLDEFEYLIDENHNLLYGLIRLMDDKLNPVQRLYLILITKDISFREVLDESTLSTLQQNFIRLAKYNSEQLRDILNQRVLLAFYDGVVLEDSISLIADIAAESGDARYALELLWNAGKIADASNVLQIVPEFVRDAKSKTIPVIRIDLIEELSLHQKLLLLAITRILKHDEKAFVTTSELESHYQLICEEFDVEPLKHTKNWQNIKVLKEFGIITSRVSGPGYRGKTTLIGLPDAPAEELGGEIERQILRRIEEHARKIRT